MRNVGYAAVAPQLGQMTTLVLLYANTQIMQVDKAAWHRSKNLQIPENIRLLCQPSYSPELMPVEHIWEDIRENYFSHRILKSITQVIDKVCQGLVKLSSTPERLRSMTYFPHLTISF